VKRFSEEELKREEEGERKWKIFEE